MEPVAGSKSSIEQPEAPTASLVPLQDRFKAASDLLIKASAKMPDKELKQTIDKVDCDMEFMRERAEAAMREELEEAEDRVRELRQRLNASAGEAA